MMNLIKKLRLSSLSVKSKISLGFTIVLVLHVSIAITGHLGLRKADKDFANYRGLHLDLERIEAIDHLVNELDRTVLQFASTGYRGPQLRAIEIQEEIQQLLAEEAARANSDRDRDTLNAMLDHLCNHREIFQTVITDRENRRRILDNELSLHGQQVVSAIDKLTDNLSGSENLLKLQSAFRSAQLEVMRYVHSPDQKHLIAGKKHLREALNSTTRLANQLPQSNQDFALTLTDELNQYESAFIQMVQATRSYLHLVNVVLAGESQEFRRAAGEFHHNKTADVQLLADLMQTESRGFQHSSSAFSLLTIILGIIAAWYIGRDISPPLVGIADTFRRLASGTTNVTIPGRDRQDELGTLAAAAEVFRSKADETRQLLDETTRARTELDRANHELAQEKLAAEAMAEEALLATQAKSKFLADMSREIRTPLTAILGFTDDLEEHLDQPDAIESVDTIRRNGKQLLTTLSNILDLSKIESGGPVIEKSVFAPLPLLQDAFKLLEPQAIGKGVRLSLSCHDSIPDTIESDPIRLRQILMNVVGNAIKFTDHGSVDLSVSLDSSTNPQLLVFDIQDSGRGITPSEQTRLFQPFGKTASAPLQRFGGTGLGLTISRKFAELMGGSLELLDSEPGVGSRFRLTIAATAPSNTSSNLAETLESNLNPDDPQLDGIHVLLAEDGSDNQSLISHVLRRWGAEVEVVEDGQAAVSRIQQATKKQPAFDIILMDMHMPVMDGYQATRKLRMDGIKTPVIALTAHAMIGDREKCLEVGCDDYHPKPIDRHQLARQIATLVAPHLLGTPALQN